MLDDPQRTVSGSELGEVECLTPFFVYQTLRGPVDSVGFFFRCEADGELSRHGDDATGHRWLALSDLRRQFQADPEQFDWLTQGALRSYLAWREQQVEAPAH